MKMSTIFYEGQRILKKIFQSLYFTFLEFVRNQFYCKLVQINVDEENFYYLMYFYLNVNPNSELKNVSFWRVTL